MIHPNTQIQYIDIKLGEPKYNTVNDLYREYAHKANMLTDNCSIIDFGSNYNVKVIDLFGWTDIIQIKRIKSDAIVWNNINVANKQILLSDDELIPFYDIDETTRGFHGEVKYKYILKHLIKSDKSKDFIRIRKGEDEFNNDIEFSPIRIHSVSNDKTNYGYQLITKSRFFNGNDIHLFGEDTVLLNEFSKWYK